MKALVLSTALVISSTAALAADCTARFDYLDADLAVPAQAVATKELARRNYTLVETPTTGLNINAGTAEIMSENGKERTSILVTIINSNGEELSHVTGTKLVSALRRAIARLPRCRP